MISIFCLLSCNSSAKDTKIIASIRPLQSIVANITDGVNEVDLIMDYNESLHNYQLKPATVKAIHDSAIIILIDRDFELFMDKILDSLYGNQKVIEVATIPGIKLILNDNDHAHEHKHEKNCNHRKYEYDYHIWLDVDIVKVIASHITDTLSKEFLTNEPQYRKNLAIFISKLSKLDKEIKAQLVDAKGKDFIVTHNAYNYFINRYELNKSAAMSFNHNYYIGARDFLDMHKAIKEDKIKCIFEEPQFESQVIRKLKEESKVKIGQLDAEWGPEDASNKDAYFTMMKGLASSFNECLK